ncbi:MAG TPA: response regulator, partial [Leptolinea sp.]
MIEPPQILLVEDEQSVITHLTDMIDKIGFSKPQVAGSQEEAKNIVKRYRPDIALVDLSLGNNEDGQTTARMLSEEYQLPVVYLSSQSEKDQQYRAQPPYDYVLKPVDRKNLKKTIMLALSRHSQVDNLSLLVGDLPIPSILVSMESLEVLVCNSMFTELFPGIKSQEILSGFQNSSADVSREITRLVLQIKQQQKPVVNEVQLHTDTGYLDFKIYGKRVDSNAHPAILLSLVNITQNKSEDLILRKQENTFFNLFNKTPVMLLQLDACGKVLHANQKWLLSTGYSKDEVHQQSLQSFLANNSDNIFESEILPSLMGNKSEYNGHLEARDKNGDINSYQVHFSAMSDSDENKTFISAFVLIPTDLVVQKSQEEENTLANALRDTAEAL